MKNKIHFFALSFSALFLCTAAFAGNAIQVENLSEFQKITEGVPAFFRVSGSREVSSVEVSLNGNPIGHAEFNAEHSQFRFRYIFENLGEQDLEFHAFTKNRASLSSVSYRVEITRKATPAPTRLFNRYVLKAVDYLNKNYGLLGYNLNAQNTHKIDYYKYGSFKPTKDGFTMCVAGVLEVIVTAFDLYAKEKSDFSLYDFLPFKSWSTLDDTSIKAHIWVDPRLGSSGTADAITKFGLGEKVKFRDLEPGGFININRTTGSGHAVVFLGFIDDKGQDLAAYSDQVAGFRYFGAQGHGKVGEGGLSYRHAFFSKNGCPDVPYQRDCNVIFSDDSRILNVGQILDPADWKHKSAEEQDRREPLNLEDQRLISSPADFSGLTTDD